MKITKEVLIEMLARHRVREYPALYKDNLEDAKFFWRKECPTKRDLLLAAVNHGLVPKTMWTWEVR